MVVAFYIPQVGDKFLYVSDEGWHTVSWTGEPTDHDAWYRIEFQDETGTGEFWFNDAREDRKFQWRRSALGDGMW